MATRLVLVLAVLSTAALLPGAALGKEIKSVTISGPGLEHQITLKGGGEIESTPAGELAMQSGFFPELFDTSPDPTLAQHPKGTLGPKYTVDFVMPGPYGTNSTIRQDVYPYATPYPLSYTKPGQVFWDTHRTHGGWFGAPQELRSDLVRLGLPKQPPTVSGPGDGSDWLRWVAITITIAAGLTLVAVASLVALRRRPGPATA